MILLHALFGVSIEEKIYEILIVSPKWQRD